MSQKMHILLYIILLMLIQSEAVTLIDAQDDLPSVGDFYTAIPVWNPSNTLIAKVSDASVEIWQVNASEPIQILSGHTDTVLTLSWSDDGDYLATGSVDNTVRIWEVATWNTITVYTGHDNPIGSIDWKPDSTQIASASIQGKQNLHIWDALTGNLISSSDGGTGSEIKFSTNGMEIASIVGPIITVQDATSLEITCYFRTDFLGSLETADENNWMESVKWSPDGSKLVTGNIAGSIYIWDADTLQPLSTMSATDAHNSNPDEILYIEQLAQTWVRDVAFNFDGTRVLAASSDGTIRVWDTETFQELQTIQIEPIVGAGWSEYGEHLLTISESGEVNFMDTTNLANPAASSLDSISDTAATTQLSLGQQ